MPSVRTQNASIYYEVHGSEATPAIVFAHGAGGNRVSWWQQVPHFAHRYRVVTFDHRSFGRSTCDAGSFATRHFPADLLAVLDHCGIDRAALVCQSMGGWTGLPTALRHPERVRCLVLCDTPGGIFTPEISRAMAQIGERIGTAGVQAVAALAPDHPAREPERTFLYGQISALNTGVDPGSLAALFEPEARIAPDSLADLRTPTLVVAGEHDLLFPLEVMRHVASLIPGAELAELPGCGHSTYFEDAAAFNRLVEDFVAKH